MEPQIKEAMDFKNKSIKKFVDAKEKSIALSSSGRDATLMVTTIMSAYPATLNGKTNREIQEEIKYWRNWFYYEIYSTDPDEQVKQAAKENMTTKEILGF